jgi:hypothetical protein
MSQPKWLAVIVVLLIGAVVAAAAPQEDVVVAKFRGSGRAAANGRSHLMVTVEGPGGRQIQVAVPNTNEDRPTFDPERRLADAIQELKPGDLVRLKVQVSRPPNPPMLREINPYELKPGEDQPNGYIFKGSDEKQIGRQKSTVVELMKMGQTISVTVADHKNEKGEMAPDPEVIAAIDSLKDGDSVWADVNGKSLLSIEAYSEPQTGKLVKSVETVVDGHKIRSVEIDPGGKAITALVPGKANGRAWTPDVLVLRELSRIRPGAMVQFRVKEEGDKTWLRDIQPAPKPQLEGKPSKTREK